MSELVSYIAPGAPATRRPATAAEPFVRPEIGFTPAWFRQHAPIDFGHRFHNDPAYRRACMMHMRRVLKERFPACAVGHCDEPLDLLTGVYGTCTVAAIYGVPLVYAADNWPNCAHQYLTDAQLARLEPPDLDSNPHFEKLMGQVEWIAEREGRVEGFVNWQGVLNNAHRLRGEQLFLDMMEEPEKVRHLFACVAETMAGGLRLLHARQRGSGPDHRFVTVSNCLVNMISPELYRELLLPFDRKLAELYGCIGIHNCAWNASPYLEAYAELAGIGYIDMGIGSDLPRARALFPSARRALMYTPMELAQKPLGVVGTELERAVHSYAPCDIIVADIEAGVADEKVRHVLDLCLVLNEKKKRNDER